MTQVVQMPKQQMYLARLIGYDYSIQYCFGKTNMVADALSRIRETPLSTLLLLSVPCWTFLEELKQHLPHYQVFIQWRQAISDDSATYLDYSITHDLILKGGLIWLP